MDNQTFTDTVNIFVVDNALDDYNLEHNGVATVTISGNRVSVRPVAAGSATITMRNTASGKTETIAITVLP